jgi:8-oxo-dGTP pyrophosphatase MutT (NUDIX family)
MNDSAADWPYLKPSGKLKPADAAVALITDEAGRYLVQLRDAKPTIFFPDHWGCFGGAIEAGESDEEAVRRELDEELALKLPAAPLVRFTDFTFDLSAIGQGVIHRAFFEVRIEAAILPRLLLAEGQAVRFFAGPELLRARVVPYDRFAIWLHCYRAELAGASSPAAGA